MQFFTDNVTWFVVAAVLAIVIGICYKNYKKSHPTYPDFMPTDSGTIRTDGNMAYYSTYANQVEEVKDHTNYHWESFYDGYIEGIGNMVKTPHPIILDLSRALFGPRGSDGLIHISPDADDNFRAMMEQLIAANVLHKVRVAVLIDEPNLNTTEASYKAAMDIAAQGLPVGIKIGVIYQGGVTAKADDYWEFEQHDIVGFDDYKRGSYIFAPGEEFERMYNKLNHKQQMWLVPGAAKTKGAKPQDPEAFRRVFNSYHKVWGIVPFLWADLHGMEGIRGVPEQVAKYNALFNNITGKPND